MFCRNKLDEMKSIQKLRDRPNGVNIVSLALGEKLSQEEDKLMVNKLVSSKLAKIRLLCVCIFIVFFSFTIVIIVN